MYDKIAPFSKFDYTFLLISGFQVCLCHAYLLSEEDRLLFMRDDTDGQERQGKINSAHEPREKRQDTSVKYYIVIGQHANTSGTICIIQ